VAAIGNPVLTRRLLGHAGSTSFSFGGIGFGGLGRALGADEGGSGDGGRADLTEWLAQVEALWRHDVATPALGLACGRRSLCRANAVAGRSTPPLRTVLALARSVRPSSLSGSSPNVFPSTRDDPGSTGTSSNPTGTHPVDDSTSHLS